MGVRDTRLYECLRFAVVLAFSESVALAGKLKYAVHQSLSNFVQVYKHSSRVGVVIKRFVKILAVVDSPYNFANNLGNSVHFALLRHKVNLIVQSFGDLENRVDQKAIVELLLLFAESRNHLFT